MKVKIRSIKEEEIGNIIDFIEEISGFTNIEEKDKVGREIVAQYHLQKDLLVIAADGNLIYGFGLASGRGDTLDIKKIITVYTNRQNEIIKDIIEYLEKHARHYGYSRSTLKGITGPKEFFTNMGYKPRILFKFNRNCTSLIEIFVLLSELYPLWIDAGGEKIRALLGSDVLEKNWQERLEKYPVEKEVWYMKNL